MGILQLVLDYGHNHGSFGPAEATMMNPIELTALFADVLVPQVRVFGDESGHKSRALGVVQDFDNDTVVREEVLGTLKRAVLPDHHPWYAIEQHGTRAHGARR